MRINKPPVLFGRLDGLDGVLFNIALGFGGASNCNLQVAQNYLLNPYAAEAAVRHGLTVTLTLTLTLTLYTTSTPYP